jgi:hypothetical protein
MIDEDDTNNPYHEHVQATTTIGIEEIIEETCNEPSLEDPLGECFAQFGCGLYLDKLLEQADALLDSTPKMRTENGETTEISFPNPSSLAVEPLFIENNNVEDEEEQIKPPSTPSLSNDKEVIIEAHSFITVPYETHHEP